MATAGEFDDSCSVAADLAYDARLRLGNCALGSAVVDRESFDRESVDRESVDRESVDRESEPAAI